MQCNEDIEDISFLVEEINRFLKGGMELFRDTPEHSKYEYFFSVPHPDGEGGCLVWGRKAERRAEKAIRRHLGRYAELRNNTVSLSTAMDEFKTLFSRVILARGDVVFESRVDRLFGRFVSGIKKKKLKERTHFIPCNIVSDEEPVEFEVGPVKFVKRVTWEARYSDLLSNDELFNKNKELLKDLPNYEWMACVNVFPCDVKLSLKRAHFAVEAAINVLRLFIPLHISRRFHTSHGYSPRRILHGIHLGEGGMGFNLSAEPAPRIGANWAALISDKNLKKHFAGTAISAICSDLQELPLRQRFIDSLHWYGDACCEQNPSAAIIKCVAAMERLTVINDNNGEISKTVSSRCAFLLSEFAGANYEEKVQEIKRLYDQRSRLMHGSDTPYVYEGDANSLHALSLTCEILSTSIIFYAGVEHGAGTDKQLEAAFREALTENALV